MCVLKNSVSQLRSIALVLYEEAYGLRPVSFVSVGLLGGLTCLLFTANNFSSGKFARRGESSASSVQYERSYLKRERAVVEDKGEGPKRPRRLRVQEGAYKEAATRAKREPVEGKERRVRRCAMVPVGRETLKRMEGM